MSETKPSTDPLCPDCHGTGRKSGFKTSGIGFYADDCARCAGSGHVTGAQFAAYAKGRAMREERVAAQMSQREWAATLGIDPKELNRIEKGYGA
jgi:DnaJ-class molecular chaperone